MPWIYVLYTQGFNEYNAIITANSGKKITSHHHPWYYNNRRLFLASRKENPEVLDHLHAENAYTQQVMAHTQELQEELYKEMRAKIKETDMTFPDKMGDYYYYSRTEEGQQYPIYCRHYENGEEEIILDVNQLALEHAYFHSVRLN
ncbi:MAG: hypothetical protein IPK11_15850 [Ignavibacteria bacterium]|nr:hypothetical protein [Ignavibacteria bacterium]